MKPGNSTNDKSKESAMPQWPQLSEEKLRRAYMTLSTPTAHSGYLKRLATDLTVYLSTPLTEWELTVLEMLLDEMRGLSTSTTTPKLIQCPLCSRPFQNFTELENHSTTCTYGATSTDSTRSETSVAQSDTYRY